MTRALALTCLLLVTAVRPAAAEWHFTPMVGLTMFTNTSIIDTENATSKTHRQFGGSIAWLGSGLIGIEGLATWTPGLFNRDSVTFPVTGPECPGSICNQDFVTKSRSIVAMGNVVVTLPRRWTEYGLRPFFSGGLGVMHVSKEDIGLFPITANVAAFNLGGGAIGFFTQRTGVRFDVRYHSTLGRPDRGPLALGPLHLRYMTASVGIVLRR